MGSFPQSKGENNVFFETETTKNRQKNTYNYNNINMLIFRSLRLEGTVLWLNQSRI